MKLNDAVEILKAISEIIKGNQRVCLDEQDTEAIDTVVAEVCEHHWLPIGEWDGVMMMQCVKCNLYKESDGKRECVHPYAMVYGGCGKPERCLKCGEILSD